MEFISLGQSLDGNDTRAVGTGGGHQAGQHGHAIHPHCAGSALALATSVLGAGQPQVLAQHLQQGLAARPVYNDLLSVDRARDGLWALIVVAHSLARQGREMAIALAP